jgi:hypothetical protein
VENGPNWAHKVKIKMKWSKFALLLQGKINEKQAYQKNDEIDEKMKEKASTMSKYTNDQILVPQI